MNSFPSQAVQYEVVAPSFFWSGLSLMYDPSDNRINTRHCHLSTQVTSHFSSLLGLGEQPLNKIVLCAYQALRLQVYI